MKSWNWEEKCSLLQTLEKITLLHGPPVCLVAVMSDSLWPHGLQPTRLLCSWGFSRWVLGVHWKDWCWSWNSNTLPTWCKEMTHWKRHWCWERLRAGGEGDDRGWDGCMASLTQWTWVWMDSGSWWWTGRPGVLWFMGSQRIGHDWVTELNWTEHLAYSRTIYELFKSKTKPQPNTKKPRPTNSCLELGDMYL